MCGTRALKKFGAVCVTVSESDLLAARNNLANSMRQMGDLAGARALQEAVLEAYERWAACTTSTRERREGQVVRGTTAEGLRLV